MTEYKSQKGSDISGSQIAMSQIQALEQVHTTN